MSINEIMMLDITFLNAKGYVVEIKDKYCYYIVSTDTYCYWDSDKRDFICEEERK